MDISSPMPLLGNLTPNEFMTTYWQKKPLLIKKAIPNMSLLLTKEELFELANRDDVESRLIENSNKKSVSPWKVSYGPFDLNTLAAHRHHPWTLLIQGVNLYLDEANQLLQQFRFVPDARLDDLMISYASQDGGVGPHFDSYDVFLLQAHGTRLWRISQQKDLSLIPDMPLKILANFKAEAEYLVEPGDMLYLPPKYAHDGIASSPSCMTYSIGFRAQSQQELSYEILSRVMDEITETVSGEMYQDPSQRAVSHAAKIPAKLIQFAEKTMLNLLADEAIFVNALGKYLSEPNQLANFHAKPYQQSAWSEQILCIDKCSRMLYDDKHIYINGESYVSDGTDTKLLRLLADDRILHPASLNKLTEQARNIIADWLDAGWIYFECEDAF